MLRWLTAAFALGLAGFGIFLLVQPPVGRQGDRSDAAPLARSRDRAQDEPGGRGQAATPLEVADATAAAPMSPAELRDLSQRVLVVIDLADADGDALPAVRGILISPRGVVLARLQTLLGAQHGRCRVPGSPGDYEVRGAILVDPLGDLALLGIAEEARGAPAGRRVPPREFPHLPPLTGEDAASAIGRGLEVLVSSGDAHAIAVVSDYPYFTDDQVARLRLEERGGMPAKAFVAIDTYGYVVGLCRPEHDHDAVESSRVLIDPLGRLEGALDLEPVLTLAQLNSQYYDGTFRAYVDLAQKTQLRRQPVDACRWLFRALERVEVENVRETKVEDAVALLRRVLVDAQVEFERDQRLDDWVALSEQALAFLPADRGLRVKLARRHLDREAFSDAIRVALEAQRLEAGSDAELLLLEAYQRIAQRLQAAGDYAGAAQALLEGIEALPRSAKLQLELAKIYQVWGYYDDAARVFHLAAQLDPGLSEEVEIYLEKIADALRRREAVVIPIAPGATSLQTDALVDGAVSFRFIIDTGATYTAISQSMATALGIAIGPETPRVPVNTANGRLLAPVVHLGSISIQGFSVRNVKTLILPNQHEPIGLLGLNFLENFKYTFDAKRRELVLEKR
jgi:clan AA aspartic protease (TIGR02281 family)